MKETGILLISVGSNYYGQMAYNMAASIKLSNKDTPIALIAERQTLSSIQTKDLWVFDEIIEPDPKHYLENFVMNPFMLKTWIYDYSPFKNTLYLDADGLFISDYRKIDDLFEELNGNKFQIHEVRRFTKETAATSNTVWTKVKGVQQLPALWDLYKIKEENIYPEYNSSFIWFNKSKKNEKYFERVKKLYKDRKMTYEKIGSHYPDELPLGIASAQLSHYSEIEGYKPIHFTWESLVKPLSVMAEKHWFLGYAGGHQISSMVTMYNNIATINARKLGGYGFKFDFKQKAFFKK